MPKHIVFLEQYGSLGGGQQVLLELAAVSVSLGIQTTILIPPGPCSDKLRQLGADVHEIDECRLTLGKKNFFDIFRFIVWNFFIFFRYLHVFKYSDLIYVNGLRLIFVGMLSEVFLHKRAACHVHINHGKLELELIKKFYSHKRTQAVIVPSNFIYNRLIAYDSTFDSGKLILLENGLNARFTDIVFRDRFTGKPLKNIAIVGRISPEKGQDVIPSLAYAFPQLTFHVLGDAVFSKQDFYESLKATSPVNVIWHGWVDDLPKVIDKLGIQIVIVPSRHGSSGMSFESFSLVSVEMVALSCIVLVRSLDALQDVAINLKLKTFISDKEIEELINVYLKTPAMQLVQEVKISHKIVVENYSNNVLKTRIKQMLLSLD